MRRAFEYRKATKEKRWNKMSKIFPKLGKCITMTAKEGGVDPKSNSKLRLAILNAKAQNIPKDNIDAAIKFASGNGRSKIVEVSYEAKGPHDVLIFIEATTDNNTRTVANMHSYLSKADGKLLNNGSLEFMFDRKSVFEFVLPENTNVEELELALIDYGLEEVEEISGDENDEKSKTFVVYSAFENFDNLQKGFKVLGSEIKRATLERISK